MTSEKPRQGQRSTASEPVEMKLADEARATIERILGVDRLDFRAMAEAAGLDPRTSFRGADLRGIDFGQSDLSDMDFSYADLRGANLRNAYKKNTIFSGAKTEGAVGLNDLINKKEQTVSFENKEKKIQADILKKDGEAAVDRNEYEIAETKFSQAELLYRQIGYWMGEANCIESLGDIALRRSDHDAARDLFQQALPLYQKVGDVLGEANCIRSLGEVAAAEGAKVEAVRLIGEALVLYARIPSPYSMGLARYHLAKLTGGTERAAHLAEARRLWEPLRLPHLLAYLDRNASAPEP